MRKVWQRAKDTSSAPNLAAVGISWLKNGNAQHEGWASVWRELWAYSHVNQNNLLDIGIEWLIGNLNHGGWASVWRVLWNAGPLNFFVRPTLVSIGIKWLYKNDSRENKSLSSWKSIGQQLWDEAPECRGELTPLGTRLSRLRKKWPF